MAQTIAVTMRRGLLTPKQKCFQYYAGNARKFMSCRRCGGKLFFRASAVYVNMAADLLSSLAATGHTLVVDDKTHIYPL